jgi:hypothetical protein
LEEKKKAAALAAPIKIVVTRARREIPKPYHTRAPALGILRIEE